MVAVVDQQATVVTVVTAELGIITEPEATAAVALVTAAMVAQVVEPAKAAKVVTAEALALTAQMETLTGAALRGQGAVGHIKVEAVVPVVW